MNFVMEGIGLASFGGKQVALGIFQQLSNHPEHHFTLILPEVPEYAGIAAPNVTLLFLSKPQNLTRRDYLLNRYVSRVCRERRADALLCMGSFVPRALPCPTAVFLQLPYVVYREPLAEQRLTLRDKLIGLYGRWNYRHLPETVSCIAQIESVKRRLVSTYGIHPDRIAVIPNAITKVGSPRPRARKNRRAGEPFTFLCLGRYYSHKNIEILFDAVERLPHYTSRPARCLINITGNQHPRARKVLRRIAQAGENSKVQRIDPVSREGLPGLYDSGDAYILPTLMETFSFTYDEAMHFGLPILTSDRDFARERCRDAALYFDPLSPESVAQTMAAVMENAELRQQLVENGYRVLAEAPSWREIAARFVSVLERTARAQLPDREAPRRENRPAAAQAI